MLRAVTTSCYEDQVLGDRAGVITRSCCNWDAYYDNIAVKIPREFSKLESIFPMESAWS